MKTKRPHRQSDAFIENLKQVVLDLSAELRDQRKKKMTYWLASNLAIAALELAIAETNHIPKGRKKAK